MSSDLNTWGSLNARMQDPSLTEQQCWDLLTLEQSGKARIQFMLRIYGRANKLRTTRERMEITKRAAKK
jgi:hypothetical protein